MNKLLEKIKNNLILRFFYKLPFAPQIYGFFLAFLGAVIYGFSSRKIFVVGVTGTKGKSTVVELIGWTLKSAGKKVATLSSVGMEIAKTREEKPLDNTMPGRFFIQEFLSRAVKSGCQYAIIEVTSEGVKMNRHLFIDWDAAIFTNLHPEHLEAHGGFEKYREAKLGFFRYINNCHSRESGNPYYGSRIKFGMTEKNKKFFLINKDDQYSKYFIDTVRESEIILYEKSNLQSSLIGDFNKYNIGAAVAFARELGINDDIIKRAVAEFPGVPGRMEFIQKEPFAVVVDYAHTPDSLRKVYETLTRSCKLEARSSRLICVLGAAGGGRDKWKRPEMGKIAAEYCNEIILTNEDPYDEIPEEIINEISSGISSSAPSPQPPAPSFWKILDRKDAIRKAIELAREGDIVIITGKGSEKWIHLAHGQKIPWSDKKTALDILKEERD